MIRLSTELNLIREIPTNLRSRLSKLGLKTIRDLLFHFPTRYEDFSRIVPIADVKPGESVTIHGTVVRVDTRHSWRRRFVIIEATIEDETGSIKATWFNQPYLLQALTPGRLISLAGKVSIREEEWTLSNPSYEFRAEGNEETAGTHTGGLIPVYGETKGLTSKGLRFIICGILAALPPLPELLPEETIKKLGLVSISEAFRKIHTPETIADIDIAKRRFAFNDLFLLQLQNIQARKTLEHEKAPSVPMTEENLADELKRLPFTLTGAQMRSLREILKDLEKTRPMNRLLQGDVGSGKTVIAALAARAAAAHKKQTVFMAPTEILARQHYQTLRELFGTRGDGIALLIGSEARLFFSGDLKKIILENARIK